MASDPASQLLQQMHPGAVTNTEGLAGLVDAAYRQMHPTETDASGIVRTHNTVGGGFLGLESKDYATYAANPNAWNEADSRDYQGLIDARTAEIQNRQAPQMQAAGVGPASLAQYQNAQGQNATGANSAGPDMREQGQFGQGQGALANMLMAQANGQGPSLAQQRLKENTDRGMAQQLAMAASMRGENPALAMLQAMEGQAQIQGQAAQESADLSQQEQMNARSQLGAVLGQGREQALSAQGLVQANNQFNAGQANNMSQFNAGQAQQNAQFNAANAMNTSQFNTGQQNQFALQNAQFQQQANGQNLAAVMQEQTQKDELLKQYLALGYSMDQAKQQAAVDYQKFAVTQAAAQEAAKHNAAYQGAMQQQQAFGAGLAAVGTIAGSAIGGPAGGAAGGALGRTVSNGLGSSQNG